MSWVIIGLLVLVGCTDARASRAALEAEGYVDVEITGWEPLDCGEGDSFRTGFKARNVRGKVVRGVVCCGVLKGCTVRH